MENRRPIKRALISVSDKTGIVEFSRELTAQGIELLSTGGTYKLLLKNKIQAIEVSDFTGFPEIMAGRVKTLHPKIHGGILARRGIDEKVMIENDIQAIDMVVVNLYPFEETIAHPSSSFEDAIENIDIGGPTMIRAAAKNHKNVTIIVNRNDYNRVLCEMAKTNGSPDDKTRFDLAITAFEHTAQYDAMIANHFGTMLPSYGENNEGEISSKFSRTFTQQFLKKQDLRYGENPHQSAAFYVEKNIQEISVASAIQLQGMSLSYNNIADTDAALECVKEFNEPACVIVKHANPCGVALGSDILCAYESAYKTDPTSAFGGIIAFNRTLNAQTVQLIISRQFVEVIIAPQITDEAKKIIAAKENLRLLVCGQWSTRTTQFDLKRVNGGLLVQDRDQAMISLDDLNVVSKRTPTTKQLKDLLFSWKVTKFVKSNAIVYAKDCSTVGIGAGQMSRVYSAKVAGIKAADENLTVAGSVMSSDAFFPFRDGIDAAAKAGITCVIQPGGSIRDNEVIEAIDEYNMVMVFTQMRHFRH